MSGYSILLMAFGQSNADVHDAGPRLFPSEEDRPVDRLPVMMPNDGKAFRGNMGRADRQPITGFVPVGGPPERIQSLLAAAAGRLLLDRDDPDLKRVVIRSEARGGRRFFGVRNGAGTVDGIYKDIDGSESVIFTNLLAAIRECLAVADADGTPIRLVNMVWLHGESDRAMPREEYAAVFADLIAEVEARLSDTGVAFHWSVVQPGGTGHSGGGNFWPNRLSVMDVADRTSNVSVDGVGYAYELVDAMHYSAYGKLLLGENLGRMIAQRLDGKRPCLPRIAKVCLDGQYLDVTFDTLVPLVVDCTGLSVHPDTVMGFHSQDRNRAVLQSVEVTTGHDLRLSFDRDPDPNSLTICYAYTHSQPGDDLPNDRYPVGSGCLRTAKVTPSKLLAGEKLYDWVPGFEVTPILQGPFSS